MSVVAGRRSAAPPVHRRHRPLAVVIGPLVAAFVLGSAGAAAADPPDYSLTVGLPDRVGGPPVVDNRLRVGQSQIITEQLLGLGDPKTWTYSRFGAAMLVVDLDDDGFDDMIVGAPRAPRVGTKSVPGAVYLLFGTAKGISEDRAVTLSPPAADGDEFGTALSLTFRTTDDGSQAQFHDLWVGAPGHDVSGRADAGAIYRYTLDDTGTPAYLGVFTQNSALVPGVAEAGDRFGEVLAPLAGNGTVVGVPHEDIGSGATAAKDAGTVQQVRIDPLTGALVTGLGWSQNADGVAGTPEAGDRFGASMTGYATVVGVPGEDLGTIKDAGAVQLFDHSQDLNLVPSGTYSQDSPGVPGKAEAGDRFGTAVGHGIYQCDLGNSAAIGAPGEDIGTIKNAGSLTLALIPHQGTGLKDCPAQALGQGHGLPGKAETDDQLGAALGELPGDLRDMEDRPDLVLVGVPGEDIGSKASGRDVGRVIVGAGSTVVAAKGYRYQGGDLASTRFGSYFPSR